MKPIRLRLRSMIDAYRVRVARRRVCWGPESAPIILSSPFFLPHTHRHSQPLIPDQILIENTRKYGLKNFMILVFFFNLYFWIYQTYLSSTFAELAFSSLSSCWSKRISFFFTFMHFWNFHIPRLIFLLIHIFLKNEYKWSLQNRCCSGKFNIWKPTWSNHFSNHFKAHT